MWYIVMLLLMALYGLPLKALLFSHARWEAAVAQGATLQLRAVGGVEVDVEEQEQEQGG